MVPDSLLIDGRLPCSNSYRQKYPYRLAINFLPFSSHLPPPPQTPTTYTLMLTWKQSRFRPRQPFSILLQQSRNHCRPKQFPRTRPDRPRNRPDHIKRPQSPWAGSRSQSSLKVATARIRRALPLSFSSSTDVHRAGLIPSQVASHAKQNG